MNFSNMKPSVYNWAVVGLMAVTFIVLAKYVVSRFPLPGVSQVINAV